MADIFMEKKWGLSKVVCLPLGFPLLTNTRCLANSAGDFFWDGENVTPLYCLVTSNLGDKNDGNLRVPPLCHPPPGNKALLRDS